MKKRVFIGSSKKAEEKAKIVKSLLEDLQAEVTLWTDAFPPSEITIDTLLSKVKENDGAVFIFNADDELTESKSGKKFITRDNVLIESGLFMNAHGKGSVLLVTETSVHFPTDYAGLTKVYYDANTEKMKQEIKKWYSSKWIENNVYIKSRRELHELYPVDDRLHFSDTDICANIERIRIMNMAGNMLVNPEYALGEHLNQGGGKLSDAIKKILVERGARLDIILLEPNRRNNVDIITKIVNDKAGSPRGALISALATMYDYLYGTEENVFKKAKQENRFKLKVLKTGMPYAIFNVEYREKYKRYNHVKVDLYSLAITNENERRSFIIWQESDPDNYKFFVDNFQRIYNDGSLTATPTEKDLKKWYNEWNRMK